MGKSNRPFLSLENLLIFQQERLLFDLAEEIGKIMYTKNITVSQLAQLLHREKKEISEILNSDRNPTLFMIADIFTALGKSLIIKTQNL